MIGFLENNIVLLIPLLNLAIGFTVIMIPKFLPSEQKIHAQYKSFKTHLKEMIKRDTEFVQDKVNNINCAGENINKNEEIIDIAQQVSEDFKLGNSLIKESRATMILCETCNYVILLSLLSSGFLLFFSKLMTFEKSLAIGLILLSSTVIATLLMKFKVRKSILRLSSIDI